MYRSGDFDRQEWRGHLDFTFACTCRIGLAAGSSDVGAGRNGRWSFVHHGRLNRYPLQHPIQTIVLSLYTFLAFNTNLFSAYQKVMEVHPFGVESVVAARHAQDVQDAIKPIAPEDIQTVFGSDVGR